MEETQSQAKSYKFKDLTEDEKKTLIENAKKKNAEGVIIIVESHPKCKIFKDMPEFKYIVSRKDNLQKVDAKIKKKIGELDQKIANQSLFLFTENTLLNRDTQIQGIYNKYKHSKDDVIYLYYSNVDTF